MKNHVKTKTGLSERDEEICIDVFRNIMRVRHLMHKMASGVADGAGLHAAEMNVIDILGKFGPVSMGRLAQETFISPANTTNTVKKLEQARLVEREQSEYSRREVTVRLTTGGRAVFRKCYPRILADVNAHMASRLSQPEMAKLAQILGKLVA